MEVLTRIQAWYKAQCNNGWEHTYGIRIETLDNPSWIVCTSDGEKFQGACGAMNLEEVLSAFLSWVEARGRGAG